MTNLKSRTETYPPQRKDANLQSRQELLMPSHQKAKEEKEETERKKEPYSINETLAANLTEIHNRALPFYGALLTSYESLKLGQANMDILRKIANGDLSEIQSKVYADIETNINKLGIENDILLNTLRAGMDEPLIKFKQSVEINRGHIERIRQSDPAHELNLNNYSFQDGSFSVDTEKIKEKCCTFLDSAQKQNYVRIAESVIKGITELKEILLRNGQNSIIGFGQTLYIEESATEQKIFFNKDSVNKIIY